MLAHVSAYTVPRAVGVAAAPLTPVNPAPQPKKQRAHTSPLPLLTIKQLASTRILSVDPAPNNSVLLVPALADRLPITVLLDPVVIADPAPAPIAVLFTPVLRLHNASTPRAVFWLVVLHPVLLGIITFPHVLIAICCYAPLESVRGL